VIIANFVNLWNAFGKRFASKMHSCICSTGTHTHPDKAVKMHQRKHLSILQAANKSINMRTTPMPLLRRLRHALAFVLCVFLVSACGASRIDTSMFKVGGTVAGLTSAGLVLMNNRGAALPVGANGGFTFASRIPFNGTYSVAVVNQPVGQICTVASGSGAGVTSDISSVKVTCSTDTYTIGGAVSGLASGQHVTLANNGADAFTVAGDGPFTFATPVARNGSYTVTVTHQPPGQVCSVSNYTGAGVVANVSNVRVTCSTSHYVVGGTVSGLASGQQVTLYDNGADALVIAANGAYRFPAPVAHGGSYAVTVNQQPTGQVCTVSNFAGTGVTADVGNVDIRCSAASYKIGGTLSGLGSGAQVTLYNNGGDPLTLTANGPFSFDAPIAWQSTYAATVGTQPVGQTCTVSDGSGAVTQDVSSVSVACGARRLTTLYSFAGGMDGAVPVAGLVMDSSGNLFGTTSAGGSIGNTGTVFELVKSSDGSYSQAKILHSFIGGTDGSTPYAQLIMDSNGNLFGTTIAGGGNNNAGTVFELVKSGDGSYSQATILYSFTGGADGNHPFAGLVMDSGGNLFGTTLSAGSGGEGTVFELVKSGDGSYARATILHSFGGGMDGARPYAGLAMDGSGNLFGTTSSGGGSSNWGTVFELVKNGDGSYSQPTILYSFSGGTDGGRPFGNLIVDSRGNLFGTTDPGGNNNSNAGTVFELVKNGDGSYSQLKTLHAFSGEADGAYPYAGLHMDSSGNLFGTASAGGGDNEGTVFELVRNGDGSYSQMTTLYSFNVTDGAAPTGVLSMDGSGKLFGTTNFGGDNGGAGTVFTIN
jgi:hypothetical protein